MSQTPNTVYPTMHYADDIGKECNKTQPLSYLYPPSCLNIPVIEIEDIQNMDFGILLKQYFWGTAFNFLWLI